MFEFLNRSLIADAVARQPTQLRTVHRVAMERYLEFSAWVEMCRPMFRLN
jgi:hypothetical protein